MGARLRHLRAWASFARARHFPNISWIPKRHASYSLRPLPHSNPVRSVRRGFPPSRIPPASVPRDVQCPRGLVRARCRKGTARRLPGEHPVAARRFAGASDSDRSGWPAGHPVAHAFRTARARLPHTGRRERLAARRPGSGSRERSRNGRRDARLGGRRDDSKRSAAPPSLSRTGASITSSRCPKSRAARIRRGTQSMRTTM